MPPACFPLGRADADPTKTKVTLNLKVEELAADKSRSQVSDLAVASATYTKNLTANTAYERKICWQPLKSLCLDHGFTAEAPVQVSPSVRQGAGTLTGAPDSFYCLPRPPEVAQPCAQDVQL